MMERNDTNTFILASVVDFIEKCLPGRTGKLMVSIV